MNRSFGHSGLVISSSILFLALFLASCSGSDPQTSVDTSSAAEAIQSQDEVSAEDDLPQESEYEGATFEEAELPDDFPASFPIPEGARIGSNLGMGGEDEFRVFISLTLSLEDSLAYYHNELPANDWTIVEEEVTSRGTEIAIADEEYSGELLFVDADTGVALDVYLFPLGTGEAIPDLAEGLGESTNLGDSGSSFPSDLPLPTGFSPIELSGALINEGYELAFTYVGVAEMAMVELNIAMMTAGWEIGDPIIGDVSGVYIVPFENPGSGFAGYAYITSNPGQFNMDTTGAALIALAPGSP